MLSLVFSVLLLWVILYVINSLSHWGHLNITSGLDGASITFLQKGHSTIEESIFFISLLFSI